MNIDKIRAIFARFKKENPSPAIELTYRNPFELLVAVILSARATDKSVNKATPALFQVANTPEAILAIGEAALRTYIKTIGLYQNKAKNIIATCRLLIEQHHSTVPHTREALEALPGVGRKTANVILNTYFGESVIAVDTHIFRISQRIGLAKGKTPRAIENQLTKIIPNAYKKEAHHWLVLHGRYVCKAAKPLCPTCLINDLCEYPRKTL
ncbi:MAG: endonuclease III [Gammaproteobacteria bacterium RIFCSPHIGHO2_12_FULL_42_10]|nr:MAG: endonuclease III [Gammaproteobacteria bacterium RIFCSPHIGHO2_12_FULL_42_10]